MSEFLKLAILSRNPRCYSSRRLLEAGRRRGHRIRILDTLQFGLVVEPHQPSLTYRGRSLAQPDAIIPRIGASVGFFGAAVVRQFEQMGVFSLNPSAGILSARDKLRSMQILSRHDIGIAPTVFVRGHADILPAIARVGGAPVIIKLLEGTQGVGVILAQDEKTAESIIETLQSTQQNVLVQKFVKESRGRDIRALVIGDQVVAAMRRSATGSEFRSNIHRGGKAEAVQLDPTYERIAVRAAQIIGLRVAGVDLLEGSEGPVVMEVNASPGLEGIESTTGIDVAGCIMDDLAEHLQFSDIDIRQKLSLDRGFTVAEFTILGKSWLAGKTIGEAAFRDRDILVLSVSRGGLVHPAPKGDFRLIEKDSLLCYGRKLTLREFLPRKIRKLPGKKTSKARNPHKEGSSEG